MLPSVLAGSHHGAGSPLAGLHNQVVLLRADLNLPSSSDGVPLSRHRLVAVTQTIRHLVDCGARVMLLTHIGRPTGRDAALSTSALVPHLRRALHNTPVTHVGDCVGDRVQRAVDALQPGTVALLENVRFWPGETANDAAFAKDLARHASCYVFDAFGVAHRTHASTVGVATVMRSRGLPVMAGLLVRQEVATLTAVLTSPRRPFVAIVGGDKLTTKADAIHGLVRTADTVVLVGRVAVPFVRDGDDGERGVVALLRQQAAAASTQLVVPTDFVVASHTRAETTTVPAAGLTPHDAVMDVGSATVAAARALVRDAATILWNGPSGVFESPPFDSGTRAIVAMLAAATAAGATTVLGGGHTVAAVERLAAPDARFTHVSTGGGAMMALLAGRRLPGLDGLGLGCAAPGAGQDGGTNRSALGDATNTDQPACAPKQPNCPRHAVG